MIQQEVQVHIAFPSHLRETEERTRDEEMRSPEKRREPSNA